MGPYGELLKREVLFNIAQEGRAPEDEGEKKDGGKNEAPPPQKRGKKRLQSTPNKRRERTETATRPALGGE